MLRSVLASSRFITLIAVTGTFVASSALIVYEELVIATTHRDVWQAGEISSKPAKIFAVGLIEAVDVFLIAIALYVVSLGLYALFVDDRLSLSR